MNFSIHNTLSKNIEEYVDPDYEARIYTCGPTVYNHVHIGNLRAYISADILKRALEFNGYNVFWVMNVTDVDDKTIKNTIEKYGTEAGVEDLKKFTDEYFQIFLNDLEKCNVNPSTVSFVKVTEKIADIQDYIMILISRGYAYKAEDGSVYFNIEKYQNDFGDYGALTGEKFLAGKKTGARVNVDEYDKDNLSDFALWKARTPEDGSIFWSHQDLVDGRPGWHIECTVINKIKFEKVTDIHTGGVDLIFPHHTNEIAQAQPIYKPFVKYWFHSEHILVDNKKMAKSEGNFFTLDDLAKEHIADGMDLRYLLLQSHYRSKLNITKQSLAAAASGLHALKNIIGNLISLTQPSENINFDQSIYFQKFKDAINEDLNTPKALAVLSEVLNSDLKPGDKLAMVYKMDEVFGLNLDQSVPKLIAQENLTEEALNLIAKRDAARNEKDYDLSDKLRVDLENMGYEVVDTAEGTKLMRK